MVHERGARAHGARVVLRQLAMFRAAGLRVAGLARPLAPARQMSGHSMEHAIGARRPPRSRLASPPPAHAPAPVLAALPSPRRARRGDVTVEEVLVHILAGRRRVRRRHDGEALHARPPRPRRGAVPYMKKRDKAMPWALKGGSSAPPRRPRRPARRPRPHPVEPPALAATARRPPPARASTRRPRARASLRRPPALPPGATSSTTTARRRAGREGARRGGGVSRARVLY